MNLKNKQKILKGKKKISVRPQQLYLTKKKIKLNQFSLKFV
jgi:hypothetical protein